LASKSADGIDFSESLKYLMIEASSGSYKPRIESYTLLFIVNNVSYTLEYRFDEEIDFVCQKFDAK